MSFDSDPRDDVSEEEYYGEMEIARLRELNAELFAALKDMVTSYEYEASMYTPALLEAKALIAKAEALK